jgi:large repetitive protein
MYAGLKGGNYHMTIKDSQGCEVMKLVFLENGALKIYAHVESATCVYAADGKIQADVEKGTPPYTVTLFTQFPSGEWGAPLSADSSIPFGLGMRYYWNSLYAGNYKIVAVDSEDCQVETTVTVGSLPAVSAQVTVLQPNCPGDKGEIQIAGSGGAGSPYSYSLIVGIPVDDMGDGITLVDVAPGNYQIVIQGTAGCVSPPVNFAIFPVPAWNVGATSTEETCNGDNDGTITVTAAGANGGPYTYSINGGAYVANNIFTGLADGIPNYKVKDMKGCIYSGSISVVGYGVLGAVKNTTGASCSYSSDGTAEISGVAGKAPYLYSFDGGTHVGGEPYLVTDLSGGSYASMVIDQNGCSYMFSTSISSPDTIFVDTLLVLPSTTGLNGAIDIDVQGGVPGYTYEWSNGDTIQDISILAPLDYFVTVKDTIGCIDTLTVNVPGIPSSIDSDDDGLTDCEELYEYFTDPENADSDGDLIPDGDEVNVHGTNPLNADTDGDGELDGVELLFLFTNPLVTEVHEDLEFGCTYPYALNYSSSAQVDDNSCVFDTEETTCAADLSGDGEINMVDLLLMLGGFGGSCEEL